MTIEQFWARFNRPLAGHCWEWMGARNGEGYGAVKLAGVFVYTHVLAFETHHRRKVRPGHVVRHTCDNPPCGNPAHLVEGTRGDNLKDQWLRKRRINRRRNNASGERQAGGS